MDIIIEGTLTSDEGMDDLLETIIHFKNVPNALLRISSSEGKIKGRIGFAAGGFVLGGCIDDTGETGYSAVKKLLTVPSGNYAVLDTGRDISPEVNQTLWIKGEKILEVWPNLPDSPEKLLGVDGNVLTIVKQSAPIAAFKDKKEQSISRVRSTAIKTGKKSFYNNFYNKRNIAIILSSILLIILLLLMIMMFGNKLATPEPKPLSYTHTSE